MGSNTSVTVPSSRHDSWGILQQKLGLFFPWDFFATKNIRMELGRISGGSQLLGWKPTMICWRICWRSSVFFVDFPMVLMTPGSLRDQVSCPSSSWESHQIVFLSVCFPVFVADSNPDEKYRKVLKQSCWSCCLMLAQRCTSLYMLEIIIPYSIGIPLLASILWNDVGLEHCWFVIRIIMISWFTFCLLVLNLTIQYRSVTHFPGLIQMNSQSFTNRRLVSCCGCEFLQQLVDGLSLCFSPSVAQLPILANSYQLVQDFASIHSMISFFLNRYCVIDIPLTHSTKLEK